MGWVGVIAVGLGLSFFFFFFFFFLVVVGSVGSGGFGGFSPARDGVPPNGRFSAGTGIFLDIRETCDPSDDNGNRHLLCKEKGLVS